MGEGTWWGTSTSVCVMWEVVVMKNVTTAGSSTRLWMEFAIGSKAGSLIFFRASIPFFVRILRSCVFEYDSDVCCWVVCAVSTFLVSAACLLLYNLCDWYVAVKVLSLFEGGGEVDEEGVQLLFHG